jgi:predicted lipoprotein
MLEITQGGDRASRHSRRELVVLGLAAGLLSGCKIVRNGTSATTDPQKPDSFNARAYVAQLWSPRVLPFFQQKSADLATVLGALAKNAGDADKSFGQPPAASGGNWTFAVKSQGKVTAVDTKSLHGTMTVAVPGVSTPVTLQIGPVVFGSAIRDCLPFLAFSDFVNQIEYAEVARALNGQAGAGIRQQLDPAKTLGRVVAFSGAMPDPAATGAVQVTPVTMRFSGGAGQ